MPNMSHRQVSPIMEDHATPQNASASSDIYLCGQSIYTKTYIGVRIQSKHAANSANSGSLVVLRLNLPITTF